MKQESFTTLIIKPSEGMFLTQAGEVDILDRVFATKVAIGKEDSPDNWREITAEEADILKAEQKEAEKQFREEREKRLASSYIERMPDNIENVDDPESNPEEDSLNEELDTPPQSQTLEEKGGES